MKLRRRREAEERTLTRANVPSIMLQQTVAGEPITQDTALRLADVLACVRLLAESASILPLHAYRKTQAGRIPFDGTITTLLDRPAPGTIQANFVSQLVASLALRGEAFVGKFRRGGEIVQLGLLPVERVQVKLVGGEPQYILTGNQGEQTRHDTSDIIHIRGVSLDGLRGISPLRYAAESLGLATSLAKHTSALFANQAAPRGVLTVAPGPTQGDVMENLRDAWEGRHGGATNAGRVAVIAGDAITFQPISVTPADAELVAQLKLSSTTVARIFRVPPYLIGAEAGNSMTYSNVESEALSFLKFSLAPWLTVIEQAISADRDLCPPGVYVQFKVDAILRADSYTRAQTYALALDPEKGWLRRDEVRELEDRPHESAPPIVPSPNGNRQPQTIGAT